MFRGLAGFPGSAAAIPRVSAIDRRGVKMNLKSSLPLTRNISYVNTNICVSARCNSAARSLNGLGQDRDSGSTTPSEDSKRIHDSWYSSVGRRGFLVELRHRTEGINPESIRVIAVKASFLCSRLWRRVFRVVVRAPKWLVTKSQTDRLLTGVQYSRAHDDQTRTEPRSNVSSIASVPP
jgi:hypothetical protein